MMAGRWKANGALLAGVIALAGCMPVGTDDAYYGPASAPPPPRTPIDGGAEPAPDDAYAYLDRAEALWAAIGQSPPDHSFDFDGGQPWAWETADGHWVVVEDRDAQMRSYYFAPGARDPFLVAEGGNRFAFAKGRLVYVYDAEGRPVDPDGADSDALTRRADWLLDRGRALRAVLSRREWESVDSTSWIDTSPMLWSNIDIWFATRDIDPGWRRYRDSREAWLLREQLAAERRRREELARRFREWREHGFQGPPPPGVRPPHGWPWGGPRPGKPPVPGQPGQPGPGGPGGPPPGTSGPQPPNGPRPTPPRGPWHPGWPAPGTEGAGGPPRVPPPPPPPPATAGPQQPDATHPRVPPRGPWRPGWPAPIAGAPPHVPPPGVPGTPPSGAPPRPAPPTAGAPIHDDGRPLPDRPRPRWDGDHPRPDWTAGRPRPEPQARPTPPFMPPPRPAPSLEPRPQPAPPVAAPAPPRPAPAPHPAPRPAPPPRVEHGHAVLERQIRQQD